MGEETTTMTGTCLYCGQTRIVEASTLQEADVKATRECGACDNPLKRTWQLHQNIDILCGETARGYGMQELDPELTDVIKSAGELLIRGFIESVTFKLEDSTVALRNTKDGAAVIRKKSISAKLEA